MCAAQESQETNAIISELRQHQDFGTLVPFIGNGVMRVPTRTVDVNGQPTGKTETTGPSWQRYMDQLWSLAQEPRTDRSTLDSSAFQRLSAPRQAEWFDRSALWGLDRDDLRLLRMHLLGKALHRAAGYPTNEFLKAIANIVVSALAKNSTVNVITTNVDCALEQNIAMTADRALKISPSISVRTTHGTTAKWARGKSSNEIRVWKIHGCLQSLKTSAGQKWESLRSSLVRKASEIITTDDEFAGAVPSDELVVGSGWRLEHRSNATQDSIPYGVFAIAEYVDILRDLVAEEPSTDIAPLANLLMNQPLLFLGYGIAEVDVDVVAALLPKPGSDPPPRFTLRYRATDESGEVWDRDEEERLRQMAIKWWSFDLPPLAHARLPGDLSSAKRHEWRFLDLKQRDEERLRDDVDHRWRNRLQETSAGFWEQAQLSKIRSLVYDADQDVSPTTNEAPERRLVVAGLASVWHGFALRQPSDFPTRRRVSAGLAAVDTQVPGGSGLVPVLVAAAVGGPDDVGAISFLSNVPRSWANWNEVSEFCLAAGVTIEPLPSEQVTRHAGARTSHVLLYDPDQKEKTTKKPRQRMILDVDEPLQRHREATGSAKAPPVPPHPDYGNEFDFLFADKLAQRELLSAWQGPIVYETGSSGTDLLELGHREPRTVPTVWTAGFGSFIRTLVCSRRQAERLGEGVWKAGLEGNTLKEAQKDLDQHTWLEPFLKFEDPAKEYYVAHINSYGIEGLWKEGVSHQSEIRFGEWVQQHWSELGKVAWDRLLQRQLLRRHHALGRGFLVTLHEKGLMAVWENQCGEISTPVIAIDTQENSNTLEHKFQIINETTEMQAIHLRVPDLDHTVAELRIPGCDTLEFPIAAPVRRHTLGAGDTVRGCLAHGLWSMMFPEADRSRRPDSVQDVLMASTVLATIKCWAGAFVEFLRVVDGLREERAVWSQLWRYPERG